MIEIQKNVPIPSNRGRPIKYPLASMEVGDSFFVATTYRTALGAPAARCRKKTGFRFAIRAVEENGVKGVRVWRIE